jgi:hypothetical protein
VPWCKFFVPKIASPGIKPDDLALNEHIMYAKCIKGHVLKDAEDWILCENLPSPDSKCWQEGGDTLFSLMYKKRNEAAAQANSDAQASQQGVATQSASS